MAIGSRLIKDKICCMCGDRGFVRDLVTCGHCNKVSEHIYCMYYPLDEVPSTWYCQECLEIAHACDLLASITVVLALRSLSQRR